MCFTAPVVDIRVRMAERQDALIVAALVLQADLECGGSNRPGFLREYGDAWLADFARRPTWLAVLADHTAIGLVQTSQIDKMPSLCRPTTRWLHVSRVFVRQQSRGAGVAEQLLRAMVAWGGTHQVERYQLNSVPEARTLYERVGFAAPSDRLLERRDAAQRG